MKATNVIENIPKRQYKTNPSVRRMQIHKKSKTYERAYFIKFVLSFLFGASTLCIHALFALLYFVVKIPPGFLQVFKTVFVVSPPDIFQHVSKVKAHMPGNRNTFDT